MDVAAFIALLPALLLHMVRALAFVAMVPLFGQHGDSRWLRLILAVCLGAFFWWTGDKILPMPGGLVALGGLAVKEGLVGIALGFCVQLLTHVLLAAGEVIGHEMGFAMAQVMDPVTGRSTAIMGQLLQVIGILALFTLDLHHEVIRVLAASYEVLPLGQGVDIAALQSRIQALVSTALDAAVHFAFPVLGVMLVLTAMLAMLARAVPNINLMEFSFGLRILLALAAAFVMLSEGMPALVHAFRGMLAATRQLLAT